MHLKKSLLLAFLLTAGCSEGSPLLEPNQRPAPIAPPVSYSAPGITATVYQYADAQVIEMNVNGRKITSTLSEDGRGLYTVENSNGTVAQVAYTRRDDGNGDTSITGQFSKQGDASAEFSFVEGTLAKQMAPSYQDDAGCCIWRTTVAATAMVAAGLAPAAAIATCAAANVTVIVCAAAWAGVALMEAEAVDAILDLDACQAEKKCGPYGGGEQQLAMMRTKSPDNQMRCA